MAVQAGEGRRRVLLVGCFRSMVNEGDDGPFGGQGGFVDTLAPQPYSLANATLKAFVDSDPALAGRYAVELLDLAEPLDLEDEREEVTLGEPEIDRILSHDPEIIGFSTYCWNVDAVAYAATELRRRRPHLTILVGGRAADGDPEQLLCEMPAVDALVVGEGELAFAEILRRGAARFDAIPGAVYREAGGGVRSGGPAAIVKDLGSLPSPLLEGTLDPPPNGIMMELSRGCLHSCGYCSWNAHKRLRLLSAERVEAQVRWARLRGHRHITVTDSALNYDTPGLVRTVDAIRRADPEGLVAFTYNLRHEHVDAEQLRALARLPTHMVLLGVETLNPRAMEGVNRAALDPSALRRTLGEIARAVRPPVVSVVLGLPGDDEEGFSRTLDTLMGWTRARGDDPPLAATVLVSLLQVYRGSDLWRRREELGLRVSEPGIPYLLESPRWSREALARAKAMLVERMGEDPARLKAAEAIVLMEAQGGLSPWHTRRRVEALLSEWAPGTQRGAWTLDKVGLQRDSGRGVVVRFSHRGGGRWRLLLCRRRGREDGAPGSRCYRLTRQPVRGKRPPGDACGELEREVIGLLRRGERRLARQAAEARRRWNAGSVTPDGAGSAAGGRRRQSSSS